MKNPLKISTTLCISSFLVLALALPPQALGDNTEVPLYIKYRFEKETGRKWYDASPERQWLFIKELKEKQRKERQIERREKQREKLKEAAIERRKKLRKIQIKLRKDARARVKQQKELADKRRKQQIKMRMAEIRRQTKLRKARAKSR